MRKASSPTLTMMASCNFYCIDYHHSDYLKITTFNSPCLKTDKYSTRSILLIFMCTTNSQSHFSRQPMYYMNPSYLCLHTQCCWILFHSANESPYFEKQTRSFHCQETACCSSRIANQITRSTNQESLLALHARAQI